MTIRRAGPDDLDSIRELFQEYSRMLGVDLCFLGFAEELATLPGKYAPPSGLLLIASEGVRPAGCVALRAAGEGICEMKRLFVRAEHRGSGLGLQLAQAILAEAESLCYREMVLDTLPHMSSALGLYRRLGFQETAPYYHNPLPGVVYLRLALTHPAAKHQ